jgi:molecular chaperone DnaK
MKGDDKGAIESLTSALGEKSGKLAERVYKEQQQAGSGDAGGGSAGGAAGESGAGAEGDVVDAEFEEVKDAGNK